MGVQYHPIVRYKYDCALFIIIGIDEFTIYD